MVGRQQAVLSSVIAFRTYRYCTDCILFWFSGSNVDILYTRTQKIVLVPTRQVLNKAAA